MVYLDAVHAGPHHLIDVRAIDCDFLVASAYKFFGPHTGILHGKLELLADLDVYKVRPAPSDPPDKLETGTQSFEPIAGVAAAVDYLAGLGTGDERRSKLQGAYGRIQDHEQALSTRFTEGVSRLDKFTIHGMPTADGRRCRRSRCPWRARRPPRLPLAWRHRVSMSGRATTTRSTPSSGSASSTPEAFCASGSSTTTPRTRWTACWRRSRRCDDLPDDGQPGRRRTLPR